MGTLVNRRIAAVGDNTVDVYLDRQILYPGGNAVNVAAFSRRLGLASSYVGCVGDDSAGRQILHSLHAEAVDLRRCRVVSGPNAWAAVRQDYGERVFLASDPGVCKQLELDSGDYTFLATHDLVHSSRYSGLERQLPELQNATGMLSFDFSDDWTDDYLLSTAPHVDLAFISCAQGTNADCDYLAQQVHAMGPKVVVITRGRHGAMVFDGKRSYFREAEAVSAVDTLGAGDGLIAGFLVARVAGSNIEESLIAGMAHAAEVCRQDGAYGYGESLGDELRKKIERSVL